MSWYRTYRPTTIAGLHLQSVREQLSSFLKSGRVPQVMLLSGPKGSGKTSAARILASIVNDPANAVAAAQIFTSNTDKKTALKEPNLKDPLVTRIQKGQSYVVQELDAASNRGIDEVRRLKEEVQLPPQEGVIKVYILDEVHMFTTEAFNALLKLLEEPPAHVMFILATTEHHKIPETIVSRSTVITYHKASVSELVSSLEKIAQIEKITTEPGALVKIAQAADGSFRDAVKMAETIFQQFGELTETTVESVTGIHTAMYQELLQLVLAKEPVALVTFFMELRNKGMDSDAFYKQWVEFLHAELVVSLAHTTAALASTAALIYILKAMLSLPARDASALPLLALELSLVDMALRSGTQQSGSGGSGGGTRAGAQITAKVATTTRKLAAASSKHSSKVPDFTLVDIVPSLSHSDNLSRVTTTGDIDKLFEEWKSFVNLVEKEHTGVAVLLRSAKPLSHTAESARIAVYYAFHKHCLEEPKTRTILDNCLTTIAGGPIRLEFIVSSADATTDAVTLETSELVELAADALI